MAAERDDKNYAALILSRSALRRWTDLYAKLQNECGEVVSRKLDYNLPPADHVPALEAIDAALSATKACGEPLGWVTMTDKRVSDPVYRTREDAEKDADLLRARGIETKVAGVYLAPQSAVAHSEPQGTTACSVCGIDTPHYHDIDAVNRERVIERAVRPAFEKRYTELARAIPEIRVSGWVTGFQRRQETDEADPPEHPSIIPGWYDRWSGDSPHPMKGHYKNPTVEGMWRMWLSAHEQATTVVQSATAWIPVASRLPDDNITVMIAMKDGDEPVWLGYYDGDGWVNVDAMPLRNTVTHWRPMPEAPHG